MTDVPGVRSEEDKKEEESLIGTFTGVFFIGAAILAIWVAVFFLYINRL